MDNKAYLDQIAVKGKVKSGPIITPTMIKLIAVGAILLITIVVVALIINSSNAKVTQSYERVYQRINNLSSKNNSNPFMKNINKIKNSDLRAYVTTMTSTFTTTKNSLDGVAKTIGVNKDKISSEVQKSESSNLSKISSEFEQAILEGNIDRVVANNAYHQISSLLQFEAEARKRTNNKQFASILDSSTNDLLTLQEQFKTWSDTH